MPVIGPTREAARELLNTLQGYVNSGNAMTMLSGRMGMDVPGFDRTTWCRTCRCRTTSHGFARAMLSKARREKMTWRDLTNLDRAARAIG